MMDAHGLNAMWYEIINMRLCDYADVLSVVQGTFIEPWCTHPITT
jgi:hypothetical protein